MTVKKASAGLFLVANFLLLAHIVIPHSHHNGHIDFFSVSSIFHHEDEQENNCHDHEHSDHADYCILKEALLSGFNSQRIQSRSLLANSWQQSIHSFSFYLFTEMNYKADPPFWEFTFYDQPVYFSLCSSKPAIHGLRAPPVV